MCAIRAARVAGPSHNKRRRLNLMLLQRLAQLADKLHLELIHKHLARWQAEVAHLSHRGIGILADADDQAKPQRLFPFIGGYMRRALTNTKGLRERSIENRLAFCGSRFAERSGQCRRRGSLQENATILFIHAHPSR